MTAALAILDLGATLVSGPQRGPWSRLAERLVLDAGAKAELREALMTRPFDAPEAVAAFVRERTASDPAAVGRVVAELWEAQRREAEPIAGALDAVDRLRRAGLRLAVISNIWLPYLQSVRSHFEALFERDVEPALQLCSFREGCAKPSPELFRRALERARVAPEQAVMIGDSYAEDVEPAARLGLGTIWLLHRPRREAADLVRVLNGAAPPPGRALRSIADLTAETIAAALPTENAHERSTRCASCP